MLAMPLRLLVLFLALTAPFYTLNLTRGLDPVESLRMLPSAYDQGFHWVAETVEERVAGLDVLGNRSAPSSPDSSLAPSSPTSTDSPAPGSSRPARDGLDRQVTGKEDARERITLIEEIVHELTNYHREVGGVGPLSLDPELSEVARAHSEDMSRNHYFAHENLEGQSPSDRAAEAGYACRKFFGLYRTGVGENLFQGWLFSSYTRRGADRTYDYMSPRQIATQAVDSLMDSPGHRENILTAHYDGLGVGVAISEDQRVYVTQNFC